MFNLRKFFTGGTRAPSDESPPKRAAGMSPSGFGAYRDRVKAQEMDSLFSYLGDLGMTHLGALGLAREQLEIRHELDQRRAITQQLARELQPDGRWEAHAVKIHGAVTAARAAVDSALASVADLAPSPTHREHIYAAAADLATALLSAELFSRSDFDTLWRPYVEALPALRLFGPGHPFPVKTADELDQLMSTEGAAELLVTDAPVAASAFRGECVRCGVHMGPWQTGRIGRVAFCDSCGMIAWQSSGGDESIRFIQLYPRGALQMGT